MKLVSWVAVCSLCSSAAKVQPCHCFNLFSFLASGRWSIQSVSARALQVARGAERWVILRLGRRVSEPGAGQRRQQSLHLLLTGPQKPAEPELHQSVQLPKHTDTTRVRPAHPLDVKTFLLHQRFLKNRDGSVGRFEGRISLYCLALQDVQRHSSQLQVEKYTVSLFVLLF